MSKSLEMDDSSVGTDFVPLAGWHVETIENFLAWRDGAVTANENNLNGHATESSISEHDVLMVDDENEIDEESSQNPGDSCEPTIVYECVCSESSTDKSTFFQLECRCLRCMECLNNNVRVGLEAKKYWPPRCQDCDVVIQYDYVQSHLEDFLRLRWEQIAPEYSDPSPTYCAKPNCHVYIPRTSYEQGTKYGNCRSCETKTCTACGSLRRRHKVGDKCPDVIEAASLEEMRKRGYKPCPWCSQMIERIEGCDHMHCEPCGKNFCYNCGRKKGRVELPCNCKGEHDWVEEAMEEMDPDRQQDILDRIHGVDLRRGNWDVNDVELLPHGRFAGLGQRVGEADEIVQQEDGEASEAIPAQPIQPRNDGFNHWQAVREDDGHDFYVAHRFHGAGRRLGDDTDGDSDSDEYGDSDHDFIHRPPLRQYEQQHSNFNHYGHGQRLGDHTNIPDGEDSEVQSDLFDEPVEDLVDARQEDRFGIRHRYQGHGHRLGDFAQPEAPHTGEIEPAIVESPQHANRRNRTSRNVNNPHVPFLGRHFQGAGYRVGETLDSQEEPLTSDIGANQQSEGEAARTDGFNHYNALGSIAGRTRRYHPYGPFRGQGERLGE